MDETNGTVLIFDSGIGGLSVLREARMLMPRARFDYVADDAGFPYGDWGEGELTAHLVALFERLIARTRPRLVIIACNTASTIAIWSLRERFTGIPFVGTVPAIKPAAERTATGLVSVLATPGTVARDYTRGLIERFAARCEVTLVGSSALAGMAEAHMRGEAVGDGPLRAEIWPAFVARGVRRTDIVVLGCTHYPFLANRFRRIAPWPVDWLDPAEAIVRRALSLAPDLGMPVPAGEGPSREPCRAVFTAGPPGTELACLMGRFGLTPGALGAHLGEEAPVS